MKNFSIKVYMRKRSQKLYAPYVQLKTKYGDFTL